MDIETLYQKHCAVREVELIEQAKSLLDMASANHMWGYLPTLEGVDQFFDLYVYPYNQIQIKSDKTFKFLGMRRRSRFAECPFTNIHLLPHHILAHIVNELPKHISNMKDGVDTLYKVAAPSILNYSLHVGAIKVAKCSKHVGDCGEVMLRFYSIIQALTHDIRMVLENMSGAMSIFDTAEFSMYLDVAEIKVNFYAYSVDKARIRKSGIEPALLVVPKNIPDIWISVSTLDEVNKLIQVRNHLYEMTEFQLARMEVNWPTK